MRFKYFYVTGFFLLILGSACRSYDKAPGKHQPYNVLFIISDDLNTSLGAYGHPLVQTPNIDRLAGRGTLFTQAHCQLPICGPSRASMLTGLRPDTTQVWINAPHFRDILPTVQTLPQFFRDNGYFSARVGKMYHYDVPAGIGTDGKDDPLSWNQVINPKGVDTKVEDRVVNRTPHMTHLGGAMAYYIDSVHSEKHTDELIADEVINLMASHKDEPFFIGAGFFRPHCPYIAPQQYFDLYPLDSVAIVRNPEDDLEDVPDIATKAMLMHGKQALSEQYQKEIIRSYYASVSFVDAQVGKLLQALDSLGLAENTIIVFTSDHGYSLGEHFMWQKFNLFEESTRVPLIIAVPGVKQPGQLAFAELIDLYPTLAEAVGLEAPSYLHGMSLMPELRGEREGKKKEALTAVARMQDKIYPDSLNWGFRLSGQSLRTPRWRYTEWESGDSGIELYDKENDPREFINLARHPDYQGTVQELKQKLQSAVSRSGQ